MQPLYIATERFSPADGDSWTGYFEGLGAPQVEEIVSLDGLLCGTVLKELKAEYWPHVSDDNCASHLFTDLAYLKSQLPANAIERFNVLCVYRNPAAQPDSGAEFEFIGYDLLDEWNSVSPLTNCGGFPEVFAASELNRAGLLDELGRAYAVRDQLRAQFPHESHASRCNVWAIFRAIR